MKKTIFIAMMLIGMMSSAQTIDNPIIVSSLTGLGNKVWYKEVNDDKAIKYANTNKTEIIAYTKMLIIDLKGELEKPSGFLQEDNMVMYEWIITDKKVVRLILNETSSLIVIRDL